jgi:hypothetical protein
MPLSRALARRIDRLALRAHAFHRHAHHPLCERYRGELIALRGRTRVCRGCTYALLGACGGAAAGLALGAHWWLPLMAAGVCVPHVTPMRPSKLLTRALPAFALMCAAVAFARAASWLALLPIAAAVSGWQYYRWRGPDRSPCRTCPEQTRQPCSGFLPIVRAERAFVRRSQRLIDIESSHA